MTSHMMVSFDFLQKFAFSRSRKGQAAYDQKCVLVFMQSIQIFSFEFNKSWIFFSRYSVNNQISNLIENRPMGDDLFHAERRTDMTKLKKE